MSPRTIRTKVFISYSREDRIWLDRLRVHLKPLEGDLEIDIWDDSKIRPGTKWKDEINSVINATKVAVLLVSANFLASDFIASDEVPPLLAAAERDGALIIPLILSPSRFTRTKSIADFQAINDPSEPLIKMALAQQEEVLLKLANSIESAFSESDPARETGGLKSPNAVSNEPVHQVPPLHHVVHVPTDVPQLNAIISQVSNELQIALSEKDAAENATMIANVLLVEGLRAIAERA